MKLDRRSFIRFVPLGLTVALVGGSWWLSNEATRAPMTASQATVAGSEASHTEATASKAFYFPVAFNGDLATEVSLDDYYLRVDGDVSNALDLSLDDLRAMPSVQRTLKIACVEGWVADVPWEGIPLSHLLSLAGAPEKIASVTVESVTGYKATMSSDQVADPDNMIALKAGGAPLTVGHEYPARLVSPITIGAQWVKYVTRITCTSK